MSAPRDRMAFAIGTVQTAQRIGPALGPVIGGTVAQLVGLRQRVPRDRRRSTSWRSSSCSRCTRAPRATRIGRRRSATERITFRNVLALENFVLLIVVVFGLQFVDRSFGPVLPLYVAELGTSDRRGADSLGRAVLDLARAPARSAITCARRPAVADDARAVIAGSAAVAAVGMLAYVFAGGDRRCSWSARRSSAWRSGATTAAYTAAGAVIPPRRAARDSVC